VALTNALMLVGLFFYMMYSLYITTFTLSILGISQKTLNPSKVSERSCVRFGGLQELSGISLSRNFDQEGDDFCTVN
jgi:hypothetical protein